MVYLLRGKVMLIDGDPIQDDAELRQILLSKRNLHLQFGGTSTLDMAIQFDRDIEPGRLERITALVVESGFAVTASFEGPSPNSKDPPPGAPRQTGSVDGVTSRRLTPGGSP